jgi:CBS domain-containing protein
MKLVQQAQCPAPTVRPSDTVLDAARAMAHVEGGAAVVMDGNRIVGLVSERDVLQRVVCAGKDPRTTKVRDVMEQTVKTVPHDARPDEALTTMVANRVRHVVLVEGDGTVVGVASARHVFQANVKVLDDQVRSLEAFAGGVVGLGG